MPEIHVDVISTDNPPGGIGEVGLPPMGPAARIRALPMMPERVRAALLDVPAPPRR